MANWTILDRLYCRDAYDFGHLDAYGWYLQQAGEGVHRIDISGQWREDPMHIPHSPDVIFALEGYKQALQMPARVRIAQVACDLEVPRGFDAIISSIPALVEKYRDRGDNAILMPLAFDTRARVCGMGVKRENKCIFIGTVGPNHRRRAALLHKLRDIVEVMPPVFGRDYFRALAGARVVFHCHAEWSRGAANAMRLYEGKGMGCWVVSDGIKVDDSALGWQPSFWLSYGGGHSTEASDIDFDALCARDHIESVLGLDDYDHENDYHFGSLMTWHTYEHPTRIPRLIELARSL